MAHSTFSPILRALGACTLALLSTAAASAGGKTATQPNPDVIPADIGAFKHALDITRARPDTRAVLVNVWATWCEPCREEMPDLVRLTRDRKARGLRLMLVSADSSRDRASVARYLGSLGVRMPTYLKQGDDMAFINGLDPSWDGTMPTTWLFDAAGSPTPVRVWNGKISYQEVIAELERLASQKPQAPQPRRKP
jgi:thiol-disulfide isomerase/thioredoxin